MTTTHLHLALELDGAGRHPASWRRTDSRAEELFDAAYWVDLVQLADAGGVDLVLLADSFLAQSGGSGATRGRLDAVAVAARVALESTTVGLVPTTTVTHTEPFHVAKAITTLDHASHGRAGWEVAVSETAAETVLVGRKSVQNASSLWAEAAEAVEVAVRLWDSWEDDAEIRDQATGRFIDRDKLHYIDFVGENFSVKGPSITPRSPQGHPLTVIRGDSGPSLALAAARADIVRISAPHIESAIQATAHVRSAVRDAGRAAEDVTVLVDIEVLTAPTAKQARAELAQLASWAPGAYTPGSLSYIGTPEGLASLLGDLHSLDAADGVTLIPLALPTGLSQVVDHVLPALRERGLIPPNPRATTLRERFGLTRAANTLVTTGGAA
ncbi:MAG: LLM class flavin-dependent oxidoreductase [Mycobacteriaceae bacterium]